MTTAELLSFIEDWAKRFELRLAELLEGVDSRVQDLQKDLVKRFMSEVSDMFDFDGGKLVKSVKNISALRKLERMFQVFEAGPIADELTLFTEELLSVGGLTIEYFETTNPTLKAQSVTRSLDLLRAVIGIDRDGDLVESGYLHRLGKTQIVRDEIRQYVVQSIVTKRSLTTFLNGFRALVEGVSDIDGILQRYWRQYAYDTFNQAHEVVNESMADELKLRHFIYQGSVILTTRRFCEKRAGKAFSVEETKTWKSDPDLIDKKTAAAYNPLIERGRWNCRHFLTYISEELFLELRPELK